MVSLKTGKLPPDILERLLKKNPAHDERVIIGPEIGKDAAVIDMGDRYLVAATDPITFTGDRIGWYAVHVNANDVACMGADPRWFLASILLPEHANETLAETIFEDIYAACDELGIALCGGHTEITIGLDRPIISGQMLGEAAHHRLINPGSVLPGDRMLLARSIAIEGTALLAAEKATQLSQHLPDSMIRKAGQLLSDPGISVVKAALAACRAAPVRGLHDPTEGGLATGLWEMAAACGLGIEIVRENVQVLEETAALCEVFKLDPLGLLASGALLIAVSPTDTGKVIEGLARIHIECSEIGKFTEDPDKLTVIIGGKRFPLRPFPRDEITTIL